jgi:hypothetical protein
MFFDPYAFDLAHPVTSSPVQEQTPAADLPPVPEEVQPLLARGLLAALEDALDLWDRLPPGYRPHLPPLTIQHAGRPRFPDAWLRAQTLAGWHRLMRLELGLTVAVLHRRLWCPEEDTWQDLLNEQCARIGQLYRELKRRAGLLCAWRVFRWELDRLRQPVAPVVPPRRAP